MGKGIPMTTKRHPADFNIGEVRIFDNNTRYLVIAKDPDLRRVRLVRLTHSKLYLAYLDIVRELNTIVTGPARLAYEAVVKTLFNQCEQENIRWQYEQAETLWIDYACCLLNTESVNYDWLDRENT